MGPTWGPPGATRAQVGPMLATWTLLSGTPALAPDTAIIISNQFFVLDRVLAFEIWWYIVEHTELNPPLWKGHKEGKAIMEIRSFYEGLISTMGFSLQVRIHLSIESRPSITSLKPECHMAEILIFHPYFITVLAVSGAWNIYACLRTSQLSRSIIWAVITACWLLYWFW